MLDIIIRGGDVVTPQGVIKADVAVKGETIAAVSAPGVLTEAGRVIDATGRIVMPGGVDVESDGDIYLVGPVFGPGSLMKIDD